MNPIIIEAQKKKIAAARELLIEMIKDYEASLFTVHPIIAGYKFKITAEQFTSYFINKFINTIDGINFSISYEAEKVTMIISLQ